MTKHPTKRQRAAVFLAAAACVALPQAALSDGGQPAESELDQGLRYVQALQENLFLDIADAVLAELTAKYPEAAVRVAKLQLSADLMRGKFDDVKAQIAKADKEGKAEDILWAMRLALADSYYSYGRYDECKAIYGGFFAKYQKKDKNGALTLDIPPSLASTFTDAAYKYAQMLIGMKKREEAIAMYEVLVKQPGLPSHIKRQCLGETAELCIAIADETADKKTRDTYLKKADKISDDLLWERDLWFGKAIVFKAHILMVQDKPEEAQWFVDNYMGALTDIHSSLVALQEETGDPVVRQSPMAECRYLLAAMQQERAQKIMAEPGFSVSDPQKKEEVLSLLLGARDSTTGKRNGKGAYNHFINVYLKYPESAWAADAGARSEQVRTVLVEQFGGKIKTSVTPEQEAKVREVQYRDARALYRQGQIAEAAERLRQVLNSFPYCQEAVPALGDLARCHIQNMAKDENAKLYAETVVGHLAERFRDDPAMSDGAGDELIRVAEYWGECGDAEGRHDTYALFFQNFPNHPSCVTYLANFGEKAFQDGDYVHALEYYTTVSKNYPNSPLSLMAMHRIVAIHEKNDDFERLMPALGALIARLGAEEKPVQALYSVRYKRANALRTRAFETLRGATNETVQAKAKEAVNIALKEFDALAKDLKNPPPSAQVDENERRQNGTIREMALYNKAFVLSQYPAANDKQRDAMRKAAIDTYEELVRDYPAGDTAPAALINIGTIWTSMKNAENAEAALSRLRKDYPDSEQAKGALPMIADSLMKMGEREGAVARYREMVSSAGADYSDTDVLRAANALIEAKEYELARLAVDKLLSRAEKGSPQYVQARFAECRMLAAKGDWPEAVAKLQAFIEEFPNLQLMVDAYSLLSNAASEAGLVERSGDKRVTYFDAAIAAMKEVKKRRTNDIEQAQCDIDTGRIMVRKAKAEAEFGDKARANDFRGKALISYQGFINSVGPGDARLLPLAETAYFEIVPLLMEHGLWDTAVENCNEYLSRFPQGRYVGQITGWRNQSRVELGDNADKPEGDGEEGSEPEHREVPADDEELPDE
ncbi:MAG: tetratricopeptide repeat protein [Kiritimatiellae bacterium]|nr:tetratricopeptide repeat protein [Kiritimatiellia bacterium]